MKRNLLESVAVATLLAVTFAAPCAFAKKKKKGDDAPADAGGTMTFTTDDTGQPPPANTPAPADNGGKKGKPAAAAVKRTGPVTVVQAGAPSKVLERAVKLYEGEDYFSATIELNKVVEGQSGDDEGNKQRAEFYMGKALFQMKFYSAALSYFDRIVQRGPEHAYYNKTLQWLASLSQYLPDSAGVLEKIGKYTREDLEQPALEPVRDQLYYLLGRYHYVKATDDDTKEALDLFAAVPERSEYYAKAKFFEGMAHVRKNRAKEAGDAFKSILRKAKENPDKSTREFEELANISLARTFYSLHKFDQSVKYFDKVTQDSPDWLASLFESSWAHFQMDGDSKALGNIHTINAPYFENEFYPESLVLKALIYFQRCQFDRAKDALAEFNATYPKLKSEIDRLIAKYPDNGEFYDFIDKIRKGQAQLSERVQRAAKGALSDKTLAKQIDYVNELQRELKSVEKADPAWRSTAIASGVLQDLTLQQSLAKNDAGNLARERLKRLSTEIQDQVKQSIKVEFETLNKEKTELQAQSIGQSAPVFASGPNAANKSGEVVVDDEHERWPFEGEYWKDELGYYRFRVLNKCAASKNAAPAESAAPAEAAPADAPPADAPPADAP